MHSQVANGSCTVGFAQEYILSKFLVEFNLGITHNFNGELRGRDVSSCSVFVEDYIEQVSCGQGNLLGSHEGTKVLVGIVPYNDVVVCRSSCCFILATANDATALGSAAGSISLIDIQ